MSLLKQINQALEESLIATEQHQACVMEKIDTIVEPVGYDALFETAEQFLSQLTAIIKAGKSIEPSEANGVAAKLTTLELIGDNNTRGSVLSQLAGDSSKKLSVIMAKTSGVHDTDNQVDKILITIANKVGKTGTQKNATMLTSLDKLPETARSQKAAEIQRLAGMFRQLSAKVSSQNTNPGAAPAGNPA